MKLGLVQSPAYNIDTVCFMFSGVMDWRIGVEPWVELTGAIFFPRPLPGFVGISNFILWRKKLTKLMFSQHHFLVSLIDVYGKCRYAFETLLHLTMASRWLHDIVKPSHTIRINIVCKTTTSCIIRECFGYNRVSSVCPSVGSVHASAQHWLFTNSWRKSREIENFIFVWPSCVKIG